MLSGVGKLTTLFVNSEVARMKKLLLAVSLFAVILIAGCASSDNDYSQYTQQGAQGQQQNQYVGGGCGVAPQADYESTPASDLAASGMPL